MCQAIVKPAGLRIEKATLQLAWEQNGDGAGFAVTLPDGTLKIEKGFFTFKHFWREYAPCEALNCLIHFRFATHGEKEIANCHPFALGPDAAMVHNGILSRFLPSVLDTRSDSRLLVEDYLIPAWIASGLSVSAFFAQPGMKALVESLIDGNKIALLTPEGFTIFNERLGEWKEGIWYSAGFPAPFFAYNYGPISRTHYSPGYDDDEVWEQAWETWNEEKEDFTCVLCEAPGPLYHIGEEGLCELCWNDYTRPIAADVRLC